MTITIFGKAISPPAAKSNPGQKNSPGGTTRSSSVRGTGAGIASQAGSQVKGRQGPARAPATNAGSNVYAFSQTINPASTYTYPLTLDGDFVGINFNLTVSIATASTSADILNAITQIQIIAADGPIVNLSPVPDFYMFIQRFGPYGVAQATTKYTVTASTVAYQAAYQVPINLPATKGPYTMVITTGAATLATSVTLNSVLCEVGLQLGVCPEGVRTRYAYTNIPFTPSNSGTNDLAPLAAVQDIDLQEVFLSGLATNTTAIAYVLIQSAGASMAPRLTGQQIVSADQQYLTGTLPVDQAFPLLALQSTLQLGRNSHFYVTWGTTAPSAPRTGFYWFD
jgi:hypothetical protein